MWVEEMLSTHYRHGQRCFNPPLLSSSDNAPRGAFISTPWAVARKELDTSTSSQCLPPQEGGIANGRCFMNWRKFKQSSERQKILARGCLNISGRFQNWMLTQSNPSYYTPDCSDTAVHTCLGTLGPGATISGKFIHSDIPLLAPSTQGSIVIGFPFKSLFMSSWAVRPSTWESI